MRFYQKDETGRHWKKNPVFSTLQYIRDVIIFLLPVKHLPSFFVKIIYGVKPAFIFYIHPRRTEDIYIALPPMALLRKILGKKLFLKVIIFIFPAVVSVIRTPKNINGIVLTSPLLPEFFLKKRKTALIEAVRGLNFSSKIFCGKCVFGLGALWPMVTRRGLSLKRFTKKKGPIITNGHCGTLISLFLMIKKIAEISNMEFSELKVAILGVGKMGENLARALYGKVATLTLIDINETRLDSVEEKLKEVMSETDIYKYTKGDDQQGIKQIFSANHVVICTTSNVRRIIRPEEIPDNSIIIDDSRPEGIPRDLYGNRVVLEGGLMKIKGIIQNYDYGFGVDENVFGCLAESYLLASAPVKSIEPTLGNVDFDNFNKMISLCQKYDVSVGDFKCRDKIIGKERIAAIIKSKSDLAATIPYKNVCWIFKVEDLLEGKTEDETNM